MAQVKRDPLLFGNIQASGHEELAGASPAAINVIVDGTGAVHRRPGIQYRDDGDPLTPIGELTAPDLVSMVSPIIGLHSTAKGRVFAVDSPTEALPWSRIYELHGADVYNLSEGPSAALMGGRRPIIAETEAMLVLTAGDEPQKVLLTAPAVSSRLGGGPPLGSHVVAHKSRLLINDVRTANTNTIRYSGTASGSSIEGHENWSVDINDSNAPSYFLAEARPDPVVGIYENTNEVFAFGTTNLQIYTANDGAGFTFLAANAREFGCAAPYSVIKFDQNFAFVDGYRRIVVTDGREFQIISGDIQQTLDNIADLSDMFGYRVTLGPVDALCWCSPKDGRTFAYQTATKGWSLWQAWHHPTSNYSRWLVRCSLRVPETGEMLVGGAIPHPDPGPGVFATTRDFQDPPMGDVYSLSNSQFFDLNPWNKIVARVDTGFIDRGTSGRKLCRAVRLTWRGTPSTDTAATLEWRDDGGAWENPRQVEIGLGSETILRSLGVYRRRQWRVTFSGTNELVLARAEEEYELLAV